MTPAELRALAREAAGRAALDWNVRRVSGPLHEHIADAVLAAVAGPLTAQARAEALEEAAQEAERVASRVRTNTGIAETYALGALAVLDEIRAIARNAHRETERGDDEYG